MAEGAIDLDHVADNWAAQQASHQVILNFRGALATGLALDATGERSLAERFMSWMHDNSPAGFADRFPGELDRFGDLDDSRPHESEDLDTLVVALQQTVPKARPDSATP